MDNPIKYSDLIKRDDSITELVKELEQLRDTYKAAMNDVKAEAEKVKQSLQGVSGAVAGGSKKIKEAATDADRLAKAERDLAFAESEAAKEIAVLKEAQKEQNAINKLQAQRAAAAEGSYKALSAQYSLNKIALNAMSAEERDSTVAGQTLVAQTREIYEEMKRLQEETGKHALNVGNYEQANVRLTSEVRNLTQQLALMRMEGKQDTEAYNELLAKAAQFKDAMADASAQVKNAASDTATLDSVMGAASAAGGGFAAFTGIMQLAGGESENVAEAQKKLQAAIAITSGLQAVQNALQKQSALMLGINKIQQAALTKAKAYDAVVTKSGTKATIAATVAQKAFNLVAAANPYVLLAIALLSVVGALVAFSSGSKRAAKQQKELNDLQNIWLDTLEQVDERQNKESSTRVAELERELNTAKARNASVEETRKIEDEIYNERAKSHAQSVANYQAEIDMLDENNRKLKAAQQQLQDLRKWQAKGYGNWNIGITIDGKKIKQKVSDAIETTQDYIDTLGRQIEIPLRLKTEGADLDAQRAQQLAQRAQENQALQQQETDILRQAEDARLALIANSFAQQRAMSQAQTRRAIEDIRFRLQYEQNLSAKSRAALNAQIVSLQKKMAKDLQDVNAQEQAEMLAIRRANEDIQIAAMREGAEKERALLRVEYDRQIADIQTRLETVRGLSTEEAANLADQQQLLRERYAQELAKLEDQITVDQLQKQADRTQLLLDATREGTQREIDLRIQLMEQQRQIELAQNKMLADDLKQSEAEINSKYDAQIAQTIREMSTERALAMFDAYQEITAAEFNTLEHSEQKKAAFQVAQEKARLEKILQLHEQYGSKMSAADVEALKATIKQMDAELERAKRPNDIWDVLGFDLSDDKKQVLNDAVNFVASVINDVMEVMVAAANKRVELANSQVDAAKKGLDAEIEARNAGYANNVVMAQKELQLAKQNQEKALAEQKRAQKQQQVVQAAMQAANLVSASALIWAQLGFPWAIPAIAIMWGSFAAAQIKAAQMTRIQNTETYGDGTVELLQGGSHASGHDVDLGTKPDGTRRRAEGGEFFAVINKRNSRRYRRVIPDVINSLNDGSFSKKYLQAYNTDGGGLSFNISGENPDLRALSDDVRLIREQNARRVYVDSDGNTVEVYKNLRRKVLR